MLDNDSDEDANRAELLSKLESKSKVSESNRRGFLRFSGRAATVLAAIPGLSRFASGASQDDQLSATVEKYESPKVVRDTIESEGEDLLQELADQGLIKHSAVSNLETDNILTGKEITYINKGIVDEGVIIFGYIYDGTPTAQVQVVEQTQEHVLRIIVEPEIDRSYAVVQPKKAGTEDTFVTTNSNDPDPEPEAPCTSSGWDNGCWRNPSENCSCTDWDPCNCWEVKYACCTDGSCRIYDYRANRCAAPSSGCCREVSCSDLC